MLFCGSLSGTGLNLMSSTFWGAIPLAEKATIPHLKDDIHMTPNSLILFFVKKPYYESIIPLDKLPLLNASCET